MKTLLKFILIILIADFIGFWLWIASGQIPQTKLYVGMLTTKVLSAILIK